VREKHLVLVGLMGTGKTTIGTRLAARLGLPYVDSDDLLDQRAGHNARELLAAHGADALHDAEAQVVLDALDAAEPTVIGAAASTVLSAVVRERLHDHDVVWLWAEPHRLAARLASIHDDYRPFVDRDLSVLAQMHDERKALYEEVASFTVDTTSHTPDEVVDEIVDWRSDR
jgi:shikimate kinase